MDEIRAMSTEEEFKDFCAWLDEIYEEERQKEMEELGE